MHRILSVAILWTTSVAYGGPPTYVHTWTDASGKHSTEAKFVRLREQMVTLENSTQERITIPLAKLSEADRELAKYLDTMADIYGEFDEVENLEREEKHLSFRAGRLQDGKAKSRVEQRLAEVRRELGSLRDARLQKIRAAKNGYLQQIDKPAEFIEFEGRLESKDAVSKVKEKKARVAALQATNGSARLVADNYITRLLDAGTLRSATWIDERTNVLALPLSNVDDINRIRQVYYKANYVSKGGVVNERTVSVIAVQDEETGIWAISNYTLFETLHY